MSGQHVLPHILEVRTGRVAPLAGTGVRSGYVKHAAAGAVTAGPLGLDGDEQADRRVHGGLDKALYLYPSEHYARWAADFPGLADRFVRGSMGENLPTVGLDEGDVRIGDVYRLGAAVIQATEPRQPCSKLAAHFGEAALVKAMIRSGRCGWYARVVEAGAVAAGDRLLLIDRSNPGWPVARMAAVIAAKAMSRELLAEMVAMPGLSEHWRTRALAILARAG